MSLTAWNQTHWINKWGSTGKKCLQLNENSFIYFKCTLFLSGWWNFSLMKELCWCYSCSLSRMPHPMLVPWLNLVQLGNGRLPNRWTNILTLHSEWLAICLCYSARILNINNTAAELITMKFLNQSHSHMKDLLDIKISSHSISHFRKCLVNKMLQSNISNLSLQHFLFNSSTWRVAFHRAF